MHVKSGCGFRVVETLLVAKPWGHAQLFKHQNMADKSEGRKIKSLRLKPFPHSMQAACSFTTHQEADIWTRPIPNDTCNKPGYELAISSFGVYPRVHMCSLTPFHSMGSVRDRI